jgi:hypothetical protein
MRLIASPQDDFEVSPKRKKCIVLNGILTPFDNNQESISKNDFFNQIWNAFTLMFN